MGKNPLRDLPRIGFQCFKRSLRDVLRQLELRNLGGILNKNFQFCHVQHFVFHNIYSRLKKEIRG